MSTPAHIFPLPRGTSLLTAAPTDHHDALEWTELSALECRLPAAAFWHVMQQYTHELHWNKTIYHMEVVSERVYPTACAEAEESKSDCTLPPPEGTRYMVLRELLRKTPSPVGGGADGRTKSYSVYEWGAHSVEKGVHRAVFGLVVPSTVVTVDNPRGMTYWPFHYPKCRAYRYEYDEACGMLRYSVVPLSVRSARPLSEALAHARGAGHKHLVQVSKRMGKYDPVTGRSTYVKRVRHDALVRESAYRAHYNRLRERYSHWVSSWGDTEVTDPVKFVYEEMAIAAYLLALWEQERASHGCELQTFVDCGCGNGFLVYLLMEEGHQGVGYDIQKRRIWDRYPPHVRAALHRGRIGPSFDAKPFDWVLGNHSDELTPWLPIITARAQDGGESKRARPSLFVLPCCFYDVDGRKLSFSDTRRTVGVPRAGHGVGAYERYVQWIKRLCVACGFEAHEENLRIPSTKYKSLICTTIAHPERLQPKVVDQLANLLTLDAFLSRG